jgi:hypothetical protein
VLLSAVQSDDAASVVVTFSVFTNTAGMGVRVGFALANSSEGGLLGRRDCFHWLVGTVETVERHLWNWQVVPQGTLPSTVAVLCDSAGVFAPRTLNVSSTSDH